MTLSEARHLFQLDLYEDLEDAIEFKLFELKQFLLAKVPFEQTYKSRFQQIEKFQTALQVLGAETLDTDEIELYEVKVIPESLPDCFSEHQQYLSAWKLLVGKSSSFGQLRQLMHSRLKEYRWYALNWLRFMEALDGDMDVKASVELDPMDLVKALNSVSEEYVYNEILIKESKRLNLWLNINGYE